MTSPTTPLHPTLHVPLTALQRLMLANRRRPIPKPVTDKEIDEFLAGYAERHPLKPKPKETPCS